MNTMDLKPNSHRSKEEKKIEKVVSGPVKTKKKTEMAKFANTFISEDARNVKEYLLSDVMIPALKKLVSDLVTNGVDTLLFGRSGRRNQSAISSKISYRNYYDSGRKPDPASSFESSRTRTGYNYDDVVLTTLGEAEEVLLRMNEIIEEYGMVSVADMYDLVGVTGSYTDNKYGWKNLSNAEPVRVRDGYLLKLPKVLPL